MSDVYIHGLPEDACATCSEDPDHVAYPLNECPKSLRPCGHHCNCLWEQDVCHWCRAEVSEDGEGILVPADEPELERVEAFVGAGQDGRLWQ